SYSHAHLREGLRDGSQERADICFKNPPNGTDAERVRLTDFARIDDESFFAQAMVEFGERELGIVRKTEGSNDVALPGGFQIPAEAEPLHPFHQHLMIALIAGAARAHAAFQIEFL